MKINTIDVTFSDGTKITVSEANWNISMRLTDLEREAEEHPLEDVNDQLFHLAFYPKLKAATIEGNIPSEEEAKLMPSRELDKWFLAVRKLNPSWFSTPDEDQDEKAVQKKRKKQPT